MPSMVDVGQNVLGVPSLVTRGRSAYELWPSILDLPVSVTSSSDPTTLWRDFRSIPAYACGTSFIVLLFAIVAHVPKIKLWLSKYITYSPKEHETQTDAARPLSFLSRLASHVKSRGGSTVYAFLVLRFVGCVTLVVLSAISVMVTGNQKTEINRNGGWKLAFTYEQWAEIALTVAYIYATLMSFLAIALGLLFRSICNSHAIFVLLALFCVFGWRNLIPLTTFTGVPADSDIPDWLLWSRSTIITTVGVVIPLITPRVYRPVDPTNPAAVPSWEQTASPLSFLFFTFLDPIVFLAYRSPSLPYDDLPPLADYDSVKHLATRSFDVLDPLRRRTKGLKDRYLFWGLMEIFAHEYMWLFVLISLHMLSGFLAPLGINRLLNYLETGGEGATVRPWVWILLILFNPVLGSLPFHLYVFIANRVAVQTESFMTQLIFQHALKIRLTEETPSIPLPTGSPTTLATEALIPDVDGINDAAEATERSGTSDTNGSLPAGDNADANSQVPLVDGKKKVLSESPATASTVGKDPKDDESKPKASQLIGRINNLISTDLSNLVNGRDFLFIFWAMPLQLGITIWFLYAVLGWAALIGAAVMIITFPLPGRVAQLVNRVQKERLKKTDARVQAVTESINTLRMIKMFGWEAKVKEQLSEKRDEELVWVRKRQMLNLVNWTFDSIIPILIMTSAFAFYALVMKERLTASRVFSSILLFDMLRTPLWTLVGHVPRVISAKVSLDRIDNFLHKTELLDRYATTKLEVDLPTACPESDEVIGFHNSSFSWMDTSQNTSTPGRRNFRLHIDDLLFERDAINVVVGPTGSGKTSMLMALLGEMHYQPSGPDSWFNLPRSRGVAFVAQESWLLNETIKTNILFGEPYDVERYMKVIHQCALERDLSLFDAGDETEVGEKGLTLSGGQKARVTLARAIYSPASIVLLDDVLSALDVHTSRWIVEKCFCGDLIKDRTIILVTHNVALAVPIAGKLISLGNNGRVLSQGSVVQTLSNDPILQAEMKESAESAEADELAKLEVHGPEGQKLAKASSGKLILAEEMALGRIRWAPLKLFLLAFGGPLFWLVISTGFLLVKLADTVSLWWLGVWASAYQDESAAVDVSYYLGVYSAIEVSSMVIYAVIYLIYTYASIRAARKIHNQLRDSILGSTLRWLDSTPVGRVVSRFTQDIQQVDGPLSEMLQSLVQSTLSLLMKFGAVVIMSPIFVVPGVAIALVGGWLGQVYIAAQLSVKREMSNSKSPVYGHFAAAIAGLISIRAYGAESSFQDVMVQRIDKYSRPARTFYNLNRWISIRVDILGGMFASGLAAYLVYGRSAVGASSTGFSLNMAIAFSGMILWWVRYLNEFEVSANSLERILNYLNIDQEPSATEEGKPPAYWPASGSIRVENLCARYSTDGPIVLDNLNFEIKSGERVGIVGRTGSGKSSLTLSLLRMIPTTGVVYFDGRPIHETNLEALRANLTIIPQDPTLISGSLRTNLDPFSLYDDAVLNDTLRAAGLFRLQAADDENKITLDSPVTSGGSNFSLGQRQIIALARAMVRHAKVLILDEATASVDADSDVAIQASIRAELGHSTLITIAHRLQTITDYDRIMVLDAGKLVEFDTPLALLEKEGSLFRALVDESADKEVLWNMARAGRGGSS